MTSSFLMAPINLERPAKCDNWFKANIISYLIGWDYGEIWDITRLQNLLGR